MSNNIPNNELVILRDKGITFNKDNLVNLTKMWKSSGGIRTKAPNFWLNQDATKEFIDTLISQSKCNPELHLKTTRGKLGGTFAHWQIALAYAKYLNPEFHIFVNEVFMRYGIADPTLAADIAERTTDEGLNWLSKRIAGIKVRNEFTNILAAHGVEGFYWKHCTDAVYKESLGGTAKSFRNKNNLPAKSNIRNHLSGDDLITVAFAEKVVSHNIEKKKLYHGKNCLKECKNSSKKVMDLLK